MITGVIADTHFPFTKRGYLEWVAEVFDDWGVERVVHIGDVVDHHAISFHTSETDAMGATQEMKEALKWVRKMKRLFPEMYICKGNHDNLPARKMKDLGLGEDWVRGLGEVYNFPPTWKIADQWVFDGVLYTHTASGISGARNLAKEERMSAVAGHAHSEGSVSYLTNRSGKTVFGMYAGCGVDIKKYAFRYAKDFRRAPVIGCGVVVSNTEAYFIKKED